MYIRAVESPPGNLSGMERAVGIKAEINRCQTILRRERAQFVIISVHDDRAFRVHIIDHFSFRFQNAVP